MISSNRWTKQKIESLIDGKIQESLELEYKGKDALGTSEGKRNEVSKDA